MMRVKKNDMVVVLTGKDRGKRGVVLEISPQQDRVKVGGVAVITRHYRARKRGEASQIKRVESFIHISNVMPVDKSTGRPCRVNAVVAADGKKMRVSNITKEAI